MSQAKQVIPESHQICLSQEGGNFKIQISSKFPEGYNLGLSLMYFQIWYYHSFMTNWKLSVGMYHRRGWWVEWKGICQIPALGPQDPAILGHCGLDSVQFSRSVVSDSLRPHELQHARPPCPSPTPAVHSDSCPSSPWCFPAISSSVVPFFCPQSLPASKSFPMSQLFTWGGQSTGVALASFLPKKSQGWSPSEWTGWISLHGNAPQEQTMATSEM